MINRKKSWNAIKLGTFLFHLFFFRAEITLLKIFVSNKLGGTRKLEEKRDRISATTITFE